MDIQENDFRDFDNTTNIGCYSVVFTLVGFAFLIIHLILS